MIDPTTTLTTAIENSAKESSTPLFVTVIDKLLGFKISEWNAHGSAIKKQILDGYEEAKLKGLGVQYVSAFRSNANLINIGKKAVKYINSEKQNEIKMDNDFFWGLIEHSKKISDEEVQELIAKIIAGEYNEPGTYSMSTLQTLKSLGKKEMEDLQKFTGCMINSGDFFQDFFSFGEKQLEVRNKDGFDYSIFVELQNLGLIQQNAISTKIPITENKIQPIEYYDKIIKLKPKFNDEKYSWPARYQLSNSGRQIIYNLDLQYSKKFENWLNEFFISKNFEIETFAEDSKN